MGVDATQELLRKYENVIFAGVQSSYVPINGRYDSLLKDFDLHDFIVIRKAFCNKHHQLENCENCGKMISAAQYLSTKGVVTLKDLYVLHFPINGKYKTDKAVKRIMHLPVVIFPLQCNGTKTLYVTEQKKYVDYNLFQKFVESLIDNESVQSAQNPLTKEMLASLCKIASSEKDKRLIKFAACLAVPGMSAEQAKRQYGVSNLTLLTSQVTEALEQAEEIHQTVTKLARIEERCFLEKLGIADVSDSSESDYDSEVSSVTVSEDSDNDDYNKNSSAASAGHQDQSKEFKKNQQPPVSPVPMNKDSNLPVPSNTKQTGPRVQPDEFSKNQLIVSPVPSFEHLLNILRNVNLNWFSFVEELDILLNAYNSNVLNQALIDFAHYLPFSDLSENEEKLVEQSRQAFLMKERERAACTVGDDIISESESDDPELYVNCDVKNLKDPKLKELIINKRRLLKKSAKRRMVKEMTERSLLRRKVPKRASKLLKKYPNIGNDIDSFVKENRVGADAWRRTGVATFDAYDKKGPRVTYKRIQEHLEQKYERKFSYGAIVQLSVARNKRRKSSKRYWGAAHITCRKARKGFNVKLNVDAHWSSALYRGLDKIQLEDGRNKTIINRDDAAGYRLDTTYTHKQQKSISEIGNPELTTRTDYVNKYGSIIQVTSYLLLGTKTTPQLSAGIVKPQMLYPKNPAQHMADLYMLQTQPEFECVMDNNPIECIRVDGAGDEGPSHLEVQFLAAERHLDLGKVCTLISSRCSGSSYLNRVELQNGCLAMAHSNVYIPSTIHGSNFHPKGGIDYGKLEKNLDTAANVYISRCNGAPFQDSKISLFKGSKNDLAAKLQSRRPSLDIFLKGSKTAKEALKMEQPTVYDFYEEIWDLRNRHMVKGLPPNYLFQLLLCYEKDCPHPLCVKGKPEKEICWYEGGPPLTYLPIPIPDVKRPWGGECTSCSGQCTGHFLSPEEHLQHYNKNKDKNFMKIPPKDALNKAFVNGGEINPELQAKSCLITADEVSWWIQHLESVSQRRKAGAKRGALSRKTSKQGTCLNRMLLNPTLYCTIFYVHLFKIYTRKCKFMAVMFNILL